LISNAQHGVYHQDNVNLIGADPARGKPALFRARTSDGRPVLVKFWAHPNVSNDSDIKDIWRSEIRQLQRLAAVPRADELFIPMLTGGSDHEGFYIVLDPGLGDPLETFRSATTKPALLSAPRLARNRRLLWANFLRIAQALELLARSLLMEMHSLGVTAPIDQQFRINVVACIKTVIQTLPGPYINDFEFMRLSPSQKKSFKSLAESWGPTISNQIAARLPQKENAA
jgi:hypothetical protein